MIRRGLVFVTICLAAGSAFAQDAKFDLAKQPTFRPGDTVTIEGNSATRFDRTSGDKMDVSIQTNMSYSETKEVLAVDAAGLPVEIRVALQFTERVEKDLLSDQVVKTTLRGISFTRKREGEYYFWDSNSLLAQEPNALTGPQIWLLKYAEKDPEQWRAYPQAEVILMPKVPVALGQTWEPGPEDLKKWVESSPLSKAYPRKVLGAWFKLASAQGPVVSVESNIVTMTSLNGVETRSEGWLLRKIDTASGRWTATAGAFNSASKKDDRAGSSWGSSKATYQFTPGSGKPSSAPDWTNKIGWPKPPPDTNSYQDKVFEFSLNVPPAYKPIPAVPNSGYVARFQCPETQAYIVILAYQVPRLYDVSDIVAGEIAAMKASDKTFKVVSQTPLTLPNNVPAVLVVDTSKDGNVNGVRIVAVDGRLVRMVRLAAPSDQNISVEELSGIAKSLRLLGPED